jgi:hypothetical protein
LQKRRLRASQIVRDIRDGYSDAEIMEKYHLSSRSLVSVLAKLVQHGALTQSMLDMREAIFRRLNLRDTQRETGASGVEAATWPELAPNGDVFDETIPQESKESDHPEDEKDEDW